MLRRVVRAEVDEFVAARSRSLLRTACLLTGDPERAEDLLQSALVEVWATWNRSELGPDLAARRAMVRVLGGWRGRLRRPDPAAGDRPHELVQALLRLPRRQRAALVLADLDGLTDDDLATALDTTPAAATRLAEQARTRLRVVDPAALAEVADLLAEECGGGAERVTTARRIDAVAHRVDVRRAWRRTEALASLLVATVAAIAVVAVLPRAEPTRTPDPPTPDMIEPPPLLVGHRMAAVMRVDDTDYEYSRSEKSLPGRRLLRVVVPPERHPQAVVWVSLGGRPGCRVWLTVDGEAVRLGPVGRFESGVLLKPHEPHLVTVSATKPNGATRLGIGLYQYPTP